MTESQYERIARLISQIRNARFGQMVSYLEELISTGEWQDFTTPSGTHFEFRAWEFDYFLAAMEIDPDVVKRAYIDAKDIGDLSVKRLRLADITGDGNAPPPSERRPRDAVAKLYGERVLRYGHVVTEATAKAARNPDQREAITAGPGKWTRPTRKRWTAEWSDNRTPAAAIAGKLLADPELAREVYKILHSAVVNDYQKKRRSGGQNGSSRSSLTLSASHGDGTT